MQPKTNSWNLLLFLVLSLLILVGSTLLQSKLHPPQGQPDNRFEPPPVVKNPPLWCDLLLRMSASAQTAPIVGLGQEADLVTGLAVAKFLEERKYQLPRAIAVKPEPPKEAITGPPPKHEEIALGNDEFRLKATVTTLGAGVQSVTLTRFKAANAEGRPEDRELNLIPINRSYPSYRLFHYYDAEDKVAPPVDTLGKLEWAVVSKQNEPAEDRHEVVLSADVPGQDVRIIKTYSLRKEDYHLGLKLEFRRRGLSTGPVKFRYQLMGGHGLPIEGEWYTSTYRNAIVGRLGERNNLWRDFDTSQSIGVKGGGDQVLKEDKRILYAGVAVQYFASVIAVDDQQAKQDFLAWARATVEGETNAKKPYLDDITMRLVSEPIELKPGDRVVHQYLLYNGPVKVRLLGDRAAGDQGAPADLVHRYEYTLHLNTLTDYHTPGGLGTFASKIYWTDLIIFFTNLMHGVLGWMHSIHIPYGLSIILLTVLVRGLMHPVSRKQARTSIRMQALMPELKKLQEKYKNDRQQLGMAQMELYRKHGVSPIGSCWVVFLQMPIFMGLYYALQESIHFRLAPFLWIKNLAAPDMLIRWGTGIPLISRPEDQASGFLSILYLGPYFNLLPVVAVALMIVQQKYLMPPPADEQQEMQQKMMKYMMVFMGLMFYKVAAGLCVYFIVSSVWGLAERQLLPKAQTPTAPATAAKAKPAGPGPSAPARGRTRSSANGQSDGFLKKVQGLWEELLKQAKKK
jgi:YidC/Oxa1 family membrane protein insertase